MSVTDMNIWHDTIQTAADDAAALFKAQMIELMNENPEMFATRFGNGEVKVHSTREEWESQVNNAVDWLQDAIGFVVQEQVEMAETMLHDGQFLDASVACRDSGLVV